MFDILFLEEKFLNEYLEILNELFVISDNFKPIVKFPRGRPLKYITEQEKKTSKKRIHEKIYVNIQYKKYQKYQK